MKTKRLIITVFTILSFVMPFKIKAFGQGFLEQPYSNDLWYIMHGGNKPVFSRQYVRYSINDSVVFCIQPGVEITTSNYVGSEDLNASPYDLEKIKKLELIGYYGYDYPNHQTLEYRMATQALIWEEVSGQSVDFYTGAYATGVYIDIESERNEILSLINLHNNKPSFDGENFNTNINEEIEIIDSNNILNEFQITKSEKFEYRIKDDKLYIKPLVVGNIEVNLQRKKYDDLKTTIYKGEDSISQNVGLFRYSENVISILNINSYGKIEINKIGEIPKIENEELIYVDIPLESVEFGLYAYEEIKDNSGNVIFEKNDLISTKVTDKYGNIVFDNLYIGKYKIKEIKTLPDYIIDEKEYIIDINQDDKIKTLDLKNELKKIIVEVPSTGKNNYYALEIVGIILMVLGIVILRDKKIAIK